MKIPATNQTSINALISGNHADLSRLRIHDLIEVTLTGVRKDGQAELRFGNVTLLGKLDPLPAAGSKLILEVLQLGDKPVFRLNTSTPLTQAIVQELRANLPVQGGLSPLLGILPSLARDSTTHALPRQVNDAIREFFSALPRLENLSNATGIKTAIRHTGMFLERHLSTASNQVTTLGSILSVDIKAQLLKLQSTLKNALPDTRAVLTPTTQTTEYSTANRAAGSNRGNAHPLPNNEKTLSQLPLGQPIKPAAEAEVKLDKLDWLIRLALSRPSLQSPVTAKPGQNQYPLTMTQTQDTGKALLDLPPLLSSAYPQVQPVVMTSARDISDSDSLIRWLLRQVDSSVARIQVGQLSQAVNEPDNKNYWMFEIPVRKDDSVNLFHIRIDPDETDENQQETSENKSWTVRIAFHLEFLGDVHVKLQVKGKSVLTQFWLENDKILGLFEKHVHELHDAYEAKGLSVLQLLGFVGQPGDTPSSTAAKPFLDENA